MPIGKVSKKRAGCKWGFWDLEDGGGAYHVAPLGEDERLMKGHVLDGECFCHPAIEYRADGTEIIVHRVIQ